MSFYHFSGKVFYVLGIKEFISVNKTNTINYIFEIVYYHVYSYLICTQFLKSCLWRKIGNTFNLSSTRKSLQNLSQFNIVASPPAEVPLSIACVTSTL